MPIDLVAVDSVYIEATVKAMKHCMKSMQFRCAFLFTDLSVTEEGITVVPIPRLDCIEAYSKFLVWDLPSYREMFEQHILVVQHDGFIANPQAWDDSWLEYDYIGAPWYNGMVGNGGFSLRSKKLLTALWENRPFIPDPHPEDWRICVDYRELLGVRIAPIDVAQKFSVENYPYAGSFGFHGKYSYSSYCRTILP